jgi:flavin reductase (DIM6/NTAB) family NADH-FMN oxidoreductase RutF
MLYNPVMRSAFMPLPVALISTISNAGIRNIAPYSCVMPVLRPLDLICLASAFRRDTLANIGENREFVVNLPGIDLADKIMPTAKASSPEVDEFEIAGLKSKESNMILPPGISGCYAWMECKWVREYREKEYVLVVGRVLRLEVNDDVLDPDGKVDPEKAQPLMMLSGKKGMHFCTVRDIARFEPFSAMFSDDGNAKRILPHLSPQKPDGSFWADENDV